MATKIFVNLPVKDLPKSVEFFSKLGFKFNPQFTNENGTCMIISEENFVMLLVEKFFQTFTSKEIVNAHKSTEVLTALMLESRAEVDEMVDKAILAGGKPSGQTQDMDFMYGRDFEDLDGHIWEIGYMDPDYVQPL